MLPTLSVGDGASTLALKPMGRNQLKSETESTSGLQQTSFPDTSHVSSRGQAALDCQPGKK